MYTFTRYLALTLIYFIGTNSATATIWHFLAMAGATIILMLSVHFETLHQCKVKVAKGEKL